MHYTLMSKHWFQLDPRQSRRLMLLFAPGFAVLTFAIGAIPARSAARTSVMIAHSGEFGSTWAFAWRLSADIYAIWLSFTLYTEREWPAVEEFRPLEILVGLAGLAIGAFILLGSLRTSSWPDRRLGAFVVIASAAVLYPDRTDRTRALAFAAMAIATFHLPLVMRQPPFVTTSDIFAVVALRLLVPEKKDHRVARKGVVVPILAGTILIASSVYGLRMAYQDDSVVGLVIFSAGILFFGAGAVVVLVRGPWPRS